MSDERFQRHGHVEVSPGFYGPCPCEWCQAVDHIDALTAQRDELSTALDAAIADTDAMEARVDRLTAENERLRGVIRSEMCRVGRGGECSFVDDATKCLGLDDQGCWLTRAERSVLREQFLTDAGRE